MIGWLDLQAGVAGDMLLGALVDAGVPLDLLQAELDHLDLGIVLTTEAVQRSGLRATKVHVTVGGELADHLHDVHRSWADVRALLDRLPAPGPAHDVFRRLAAAEAAVHGVTPDEVRFHEVGALDSLGDVVAACAGFRHLGLERLTASRVALGSGTTRGAHGPLPVPGPAVLQLLSGVPVHAGPAAFESATPTGAALVAALVDDWGALPEIAPTGTGVGAGTRESEHSANVVRLVLGRPVATTTTELLLEANVDDLDPRVWPGVLQHLLEAGAHDAWLTPILMKKGRPAHTLSALLPLTALDAVRRVVFRETSTLGARSRTVDKHALERSFSTVAVDGCAIAVKHAWYDGELVSSTPEWDDVARAAEALGRPAQQVLRAAVVAAQTTTISTATTPTAAGLTPGAAQTSAKNASAPSPPASGTPTQS